jgi:hypothetical protein
VLALQPHLVNDKMYYAIALVQVGKTIFRENKDEAVKNFEAALKINTFGWDNQVKVKFYE